MQKGKQDCKKAAKQIFHNKIASCRQFSSEGLVKAQLIEIQLKKEKNYSVNTYF